MFKRLRTSLQYKLLAFSFALVTVPCVVFGLIAFTSVRSALKIAVGRQLAELARDTASALGDFLDDEARRVRAWGRQEVMREITIDDLDKRVARFLTAIKGENDLLVELSCTNATGAVVAATQPARIGADYSKQDWWRRAVAGNDVFRGPRVFPVTEAPQLSFAAPIYDPEQSDKIIGVVLAVYDWTKASSFAERIRQNSEVMDLAHAEIGILDQDGVVIAALGTRHDEIRIGANLRLAGWSVAQVEPPPSSPRYVVESVAGALVGYSRLETNEGEWSTLVAESLAASLAPAYRTARRLGLVLGGVLLSALFVAWFVGDRMSRPLRELTNATREWAEPGRPPQPVPVRSSDEIGALAGSFNSMVAELVRAQEALINAAKFAFIGEVAAGIVHEVRTPLGILRSSAQILTRSVVDERPQTQELLGMIIAEVDRLDRVVDGLLELARPRPPQLCSVPLAPILARAVAFAQAQAAERSITIHSRLDAALAPALCDGDQIYQVALNLIVNALQVMPRDGQKPGAIEVRTVARAADSVGFEVEDNGPGIAPEVQEHIFTPFFTMREGGTGLGLALAQRVVQQHRGRISVDSAVGRGTVIRVELPRGEET